MRDYWRFTIEKRSCDFLKILIRGFGYGGGLSGRSRLPRYYTLKITLINKARTESHGGRFQRGGRSTGHHRFTCFAPLFGTLLVTFAVQEKSLACRGDRAAEGEEEI